MKRLALLFEFYRKNLVAVVLLLVIMIASLFYFVNFLGLVGYHTYPMQLMEQLGQQDGIYFMAADSMEDIMTSHTTAYNEFRTQDFSAVKAVVSPGNAKASVKNVPVVNVVVCNEDYIQEFNFVDHGQWFSSAEGDPDSPLEIVVGGLSMAGFRPGQMIDLTLLDLWGEPLLTVEAKVIGNDTTPTVGLSLQSQAQEINAYMLFQRVHNILFIRESDYTRLADSSLLDYPNNFLVIFREDATDEEKQQVLDFLDQRGFYQSFETIRQNSEATLSQQLRQDMPRPLSMLLVSAFAMIAVSVLLTQKQMRDYQVYFLVGYSRRKCFWNTFVAIFVLGIVAGGVNLLYLLYQQFSVVVFSTFSNALSDPTYLVMGSSAWYILLFVVVSALLSTLIPFAMLRKRSSIELYRRPS